LNRRPLGYGDGPGPKRTRWAASPELEWRPGQPRDHRCEVGRVFLDGLRHAQVLAGQRAQGVSGHGWFIASLSPPGLRPGSAQPIARDGTAVRWAGSGVRRRRSAYIEPKVSPMWAPSVATANPAPQNRRSAAFDKLRNALHMGSHREDVHDPKRRCDPLRAPALMRSNEPVTCGDAVWDARGRRRPGAGDCE
jgi:hypothetical protein